MAVAAGAASAGSGAAVTFLEPGTGAGQCSLPPAGFSRPVGAINDIFLQDLTH